MKFNEIPSFLMNFWPKRNFYDILANFQGMYCFEQLKLLATYSLMVLMRLKISSEKFILCGKYLGRKFVAIVHSSQKDLVEFVVWYCST